MISASFKYENIYEKLSILFIIKYYIYRHAFVVKDLKPVWELQGTN